MSRSQRLAQHHGTDPKKDTQLILVWFLKEGEAMEKGSINTTIRSSTRPLQVVRSPNLHQNHEPLILLM